VFIAIVKASQAEAVVTRLRESSETAHASCIGEITTSHPRQVLLTSAIGGKRVVNRLTGEQLPRIC